MKKLMMMLLAMASMAVQAQVNDNPSEDTEDNVLFYETFDGMTGKGGNDGNWNIGPSLNMFSFSTEGTVNEGWSNISTLIIPTDVRPAYQCVCIGTTGNLVSPALENLSSAAILTFRAGATKDYKSRLKVTVMNAGEFVGQDGSKEVFIDLPSKEFGEYSFIIKNCTAKTQLAFTNPDVGTALLLDDVKLEGLVNLDENKNNMLTIVQHNGEETAVVLGRTLSPEYWNTICLPFAMNQEQITAAFGEGTKVAAFKKASSLLKKELVFENVSEMEAGVPYLIKPQEEVSNAIVENVTIKASLNHTVTKGVCSFVGTTSTIALPNNSHIKYYILGENGQLSQSEVDENNICNILGLRAYFLGVDENYTINVDGTATSISTIDGGEKTAAKGTYDLNGRQVSNPTNGIFIKEGKKVVIK